MCIHEDGFLTGTGIPHSVPGAPAAAELGFWGTTNNLHAETARRTGTLITCDFSKVRYHTFACSLGNYPASSRSPPQFHSPVPNVHSLGIRRYNHHTKGPYSGPKTLRTSWSACNHCVVCGPHCSQPIDHRFLAFILEEHLQSSKHHQSRCYPPTNQVFPRPGSDLQDCMWHVACL